MFFDPPNALFLSEVLSGREIETARHQMLRMTTQSRLNFVSQHTWCHSGARADRSPLKGHKATFWILREVITAVSSMRPRR